MFPTCLHSNTTGDGRVEDLATWGKRENRGLQRTRDSHKVSHDLSGRGLSCLEKKAQVRSSMMLGVKMGHMLSAQYSSNMIISADIILHFGLGEKLRDDA